MKKLISILICISLLCSIVSAYALTYDDLLQKAEEYAAAGDYVKAFACYDLAMKDDPGNMEAYIRAGRLHLTNGEAEEAGICAETVLATDTTSSDAWLLKCQVDIALGDITAFESDTLYAEICGVDLSPCSAEIGEMYAKAGFADKAVQYFSLLSVDNLDENQKALYRRALISAGERDKASVLGLEAGAVRNEKLDAAFESGFPVFVETDSSAIKPEAADFEISDEAKAIFKELGSDEDVKAALSRGLQDTVFIPVSRSPEGNSGLYFVGTTVVTMYNDKYHLIYPSATRGVEDTYLNLQKYYEQFNKNASSLLGGEGVVYSPDGRYAAVYNIRFLMAYMQFFMDPILLDLSTGEMFLAATYPNVYSEDGAAAVSSAVFSADGKYFYYVLYGKFENGRVRLCRYDLSSGENEICVETEKLAYYPSISEMADGSILLLNDIMKADEKQSLVVVSFRNGAWELTEKSFGHVRNYGYTNRMKAAANTGYVSVLQRLTSSAVAFQVIDPNNGFSGLERFLCVSRETGEVAALSLEEYMAVMDNIRGKISDSTGGSLVQGFPYQAINYIVFSPDGNYALLSTNNITGEETERVFAFYLVRLEDLAVREVKGLDAGSFVKRIQNQFLPGIEWNTDELIIYMDDGIKTYVIAAGE